MPKVRYYTVTETRMVQVAANSPVEAAQIADKAFAPAPVQDSNGSLKSKEDLPDIWGNTTSVVQRVEMTIKERGV